MYTISHIRVPRMYEQSYMPFLCFSFLSFFIYFYSTQNTCTSNRTHISYVFFFLFLVYDYLMVSVTSTLPFRDTLHFTITTTTTTTMTTPTTKPPPPPPSAQTRPPPFQEPRREKKRAQMTPDASFGP